ncbi:MAG: hypothetical protein ABI640_14395 [Gammaproteobacteria bacterium]
MRLSLFLVFAMLCGCSTRLSVESQFTLNPASRLPHWFSVPDGYSRSDVTVRLTYYTELDPRIELLTTSSNKRLADVSGKDCTLPRTLSRKNANGGYDPDVYPMYVYIDVNGVREVVEHIMGPTIRIVDDPELVREANESREC